MQFISITIRPRRVIAECPFRRSASRVCELPEYNCAPCFTATQRHRSKCGYKSTRRRTIRQLIFRTHVVSEGKKTKQKQTYIIDRVGYCSYTTCQRSSPSRALIACVWCASCTECTHVLCITSYVIVIIVCRLIDTLGVWNKEHSKTAFDRFRFVIN